MQYRLLIVIMLYLPLFLNQCILSPENPRVGDNVLMSCYLQAPYGTAFLSTVLEMKVDVTTPPFTCEKIQEKLGIQRYNGYPVIDITRLKLRCEISILYLYKSDFNTNFTFQQQLENRTYIQFRFSLNNSAMTPDFNFTSSVGSNFTSSVGSNFTSLPNCSNYTNNSMYDFGVWRSTTYSFSSIIIFLIVFMIVFIPILFKTRGALISKYLRRICPTK